MYNLQWWTASSQDKIHPFCHSIKMVPEKLWTIISVESLLILSNVPPVVPWGGLKPTQQLWLSPNMLTKNLTDALPRKCYDSFLSWFACVLLKQLYAGKLAFPIHLSHSFSKLYFKRSYMLNCKLLEQELLFLLLWFLTSYFSSKFISKGTVESQTIYNAQYCKTKYFITI